MIKTPVRPIVAAVATRECVVIWETVITNTTKGYYYYILRTSFHLPPLADGPAIINVNIYLRTISRIDDVKMVRRREARRQNVEECMSSFLHLKRGSRNALLSLLRIFKGKSKKRLVVHILPSHLHPSLFYTTYLVPT